MHIKISDIEKKNCSFGSNTMIEKTYCHVNFMNNNIFLYNFPKGQVHVPV